MQGPDRTEQLSAQPIPSSDRVFARVVEQIARSASSPAELEQRLRALYPNVRLSRRSLSDEPQVYYVYRDGTFRSDPTERWWEEPGTPYVEIAAATGLITRVNGSWAALMEAHEEQLVGRRYSDFLLPEAQDTAAVLFAVLVATSEVRSHLLLRRPDGKLLGVEFRAACNGDICRVHYRPTSR